VIKISVFAFGGGLIATIIGLYVPQFQYESLAERNGLRAFFILTALMRTLSLMLCLFMFLCSMLGYVVLKREARSVPQAISGLLRMLVVTAILVLTVSFQFAHFFLKGFPAISFGTFYIPAWFELGFVFCLMHASQSGVMLYVIVQASYCLRPRPTVSIKMLNKPPLVDEEDERSSNSVPMAYQV
jgi:hypothetical protein